MPAKIVNRPQSETKSSFCSFITLNQKCINAMLGWCSIQISAMQTRSNIESVNCKNIQSSLNKSIYNEREIDIFKPCDRR